MDAQHRLCIERSMARKQTLPDYSHHRGYFACLIARRIELADYQPASIEATASSKVVVLIEICIYVFGVCLLLESTRTSILPKVWWSGLNWCFDGVLRAAHYARDGRRMESSRSDLVGDGM